MCVFIYRYMGESYLMLLLNYMKIIMITMSLVHTGSLMGLQCAPSPDKRRKNDHIAAVVYVAVSMHGLELIC